MYKLCFISLLLLKNILLLNRLVESVFFKLSPAERIIKLASLKEKTFKKRCAFWNQPLHKKWSFPLIISPVNVTKSKGHGGFGHIWSHLLKKSLMENFIFCAVRNNLQFSDYDQFLLQRTLREMCPYSELFWSVFSRIRTQSGKIRSISPYSIQMRENTDQNYSEYGHFLRSGNGF